MSRPGGRWLALAASLLLSLSGCAGASIHDAHGLVYRAWAFGQGHASAGRCDRIASDVSSSTNGTEERTSKEDERGQLCAVASGGRGSPGIYATIAAGFAALGVLLAGLF